MPGWTWSPHHAVGAAPCHSDRDLGGMFACHNLCPTVGEPYLKLRFRSSTVLRLATTVASTGHIPLLTEVVLEPLFKLLTYRIVGSNTGLLYLLSDLQLQVRGFV